MPTSIFVNLPVKDLNRSVEFFTALGYTFNANFTNENATCMIVEDGSIYVMLLVEPFFKSFMQENETICDTKNAIETFLCFSADSREKVDEIVNKAKNNGARIVGDPQDHGFMYNHGFRDLDGHCWEFTYMDMNAVPQ